MHNPNPFDFVAFSQQPILRTEKKFDSMGAKLSGYMDVKITALTPIHVVGSSTRTNNIPESWHYRQDGLACIPAASIRGCLRSFIEALTAGWVSQAEAEYPKVFGKKPNENRHIGFHTFEQVQNEGDQRGRFAVPSEFQPQTPKDGKIDLASYLFGIVYNAQGQESGNSQGKNQSRKSKIWIEDAFVDEEHLVRNKYWYPDIGGKAFMGGAKPSASNWWYFTPSDIWPRPLKNQPDRAEFVGDRFWGRKFYYHQNPVKATRYYLPTNNNWKYSDEAPFEKVWMECIAAAKSTEVFRIYLDRVPAPLVKLLALALRPGNNIRHKLGYGKAYGYGSVAFIILGTYLRKEHQKTGIPSPLEDWQKKVQAWIANGWQPDNLVQGNLTSLIDRNALNQLAQILGWQDSSELLFTYPPYDKNFKKSIQFSEVNKSYLEAKEFVKIAESLFHLKKSIHFRQYQEKSNGWEVISSRKP